MEVKVLGTGSDKCSKLFSEVEAAIAHTGLETNLCKIERIQDIMKYGVIMTPALIINGEIKSMGQIPNRSEIVSWLVAASVTEEMMDELRLQRREWEQERRQNSGQ
jgi:small redox-active disulfide protein 2